MIVYRDWARPLDPAAALRRGAAILRQGGADHGTITGLLIETGEIEAAAADAGADGDPGVEAIASASMALGRLFRLSWLQAPAPVRRQAEAAAAERLGAAGRQALPAILQLRVSEGYAFYALYPETYLEAASGVAAAMPPGDVACIGIRSIGTSLSAVVAAALEAAGNRVLRVTVRPKGHPFDRTVALPQALGRWGAATPEGRALVIDEGPGLSGSSFCGTAAALEALGVGEDRIVLFPSWLPDPDGLISPMARDLWPRLGKAHVSFEEGWLARGRLPEPLLDVAGGRWRRLVYASPADYPAVQPQHERRKYLHCAGGDEPRLFKFAGLGSYGHAALDRARLLADAGFGPPVEGLRDGFLEQRFVAGRPLREGDADDAFLTHALGYLAFLRQRFATGSAPDPAALVQMIQANVAEGLGRDCAAPLAGLDRHIEEALRQGEAVALDARTAPHEWLATATGFCKTDGLDHHADHFFPGAHDISWDVAGLIEDFGLDDRRADALAAALGERIGEPRLAARVPVHRLAWLAFRLGYVTMAAEALGRSADGQRMRGLARRYRPRLIAAVHRVAGSGGA